MGHKASRLPTANSTWSNGSSSSSSRRKRDNGPAPAAAGTHAALMTSVAVDDSNIEFDDEDCFQSIAMELIMHVLEYCSTESLGRIQCVSKFWYLTAKANELWYYALRRDTKDWLFPNFPRIKFNVPIESTKWKKICANHMMTRTCRICSLRYCEAFNHPQACKRHKGSYNENWSGAQSVWSCCHAREKDAPGCYLQQHHDVVLLHSQPREINGVDLFQGQMRS
eukprot:TRINITY_DN5637_c0_g1_i1.p1 TRINITY_DN5637_c0_g1~~TRINITY_DN5637_c0_g1_i1.p1  ORF type:complete len:231 (-),score=26.61 TRINITY_DN5637_c0_g1_i1:87-758(-)